MTSTTDESDRFWTSLANDIIWSLQRHAERGDPEHCPSCDGYPPGCMTCNYEPTRTEAEIAEEERRRWGDEQVDRRRGT